MSRKKNKIVGKKTPLASRIEELMNDYGAASDYAFERLTGVDRSTIRGWLEDGANISPKTVKKLAAALQISEKWLEFGYGVKREGQGTPTDHNVYAYVDGRQLVPHDRENSPSETVPGDHYIMIPKIDVELSAGGGSFVYDEPAGKLHAFRNSWIRDVIKPHGRLVLVDVTGDSMEPSFKKGDTVLIDLGRRNIVNDSVYAIRTGGTTFIKQLSYMADGKVRVTSINQLYAPEIHPAEDVDIVGQVRWLGRTLT